MQAILTRYHRPTDRRGARVSATIRQNGKTHRATISYDYGIHDGNYVRAARVLIRKLKLESQLYWERGSFGDDYVFVQRSGDGTFQCALNSNGQWEGI